MPVYRTIPARHRVEIEKIRGSRFIATAAPVESSSEASQLIASIEQEMPDASHHCWAWRLDHDTSRASDAGEPRGSAGQPILNQITGLDLQHVGVVVTRYFGGTKLGTGGLVRAYGAAARAALDDAGLVERHATTRFQVRHAYELSGIVKSVLVAHTLETEHADYDAEEIRLTVAVPIEEADAFRTELLDRTAGRARIDEQAPDG